MNKTKKRSFIILLIVLLISLSFASHMRATAADEAPVEVSNYSEFVSAIIQANEGDTIIITGVIDMPAVSFGIKSKHLTFKRGNAESEFNVTYNPGENPATLSNFTFDGDGIESSTPFFNINHSINLNNITIKNFSSTTLSGAVAIWSDEVFFNNCKFDNNRGFNGGHISFNGDAIVNIKNSEFTNGYATIKGGAIMSSSTASKCIIESSIIRDNEAGEYGGGILNNGVTDIKSTKIYNNKAGIGGADIFNVEWGRLTMEDSLDDLMLLFINDYILPIGWITDYTDEFQNPGNTEYLKFKYELIPKEVILDPSSLGSSGDKKIINLESGKYYKITVDDSISYSKADGSLTTIESEAEALSGTEIIGLINDVTYLVEEYIPPVIEEPTDPKPDPETPGKEDPVEEEKPTEEKPKDPVDKEPGKEKPTEQGSSSSSNITTTSNSNNTTNRTDTNTTTNNSDSKDESSTVNNYSYDNSTHNTTESTQLPPNNVINGKVGQTPSSQNQTVSVDRGSITDGKDMTINVNVNLITNEKEESEPKVMEVASSNIEEVQSSHKSNITWIELVIVCLLFGIFICVFRRPITK